MNLFLAIMLGYFSFTIVLTVVTLYNSWKDARRRK